MNILCLYDATQTFTNTLYEYLLSLGAFSSHRYFFAHIDRSEQLKIDLRHFDGICVHYSVRLPYDHLSNSTSEAIREYKGIKFLFIQDEYDHTSRAQYWIKTLGFQLVFTCVPAEKITQIYPPTEFPNVHFVSVLTGYVPLKILNPKYLTLPSQRPVMFGYRTRNLPIRYGKLGIEKVKVGSIVKEYCIKNNVTFDIEWSEEKRLYGTSWNIFLSSCRSMLGSESGCNVFDWDGILDRDVDQFKKLYPQATDIEIYTKVIQPLENEEIMNQISPKIFEAIAAGTVLVLFEGRYSGILKPNVHFIPLKKDGSNIHEVHTILENSEFVDTMAENAYRDIILSEKYTYKEFVHFVDKSVEYCFENIVESNSTTEELSDYDAEELPRSYITTRPIRAHAPGARVWSLRYKNYILNIEISLLWLWLRIPNVLKYILRPVTRNIMSIYQNRRS